MDYWGSLLLEAIGYTAMLFAAHAFWVNRDLIEPAMARHERWSYPVGFAYYSAAIAIAVVMKRLLAGK